MKNQKTTAVPVPKYLQRVFVYSVVAAVAVSFVEQFMLAMMQISSNPNLSSFYLTFLVMSLLPLLMFLLAFVLVSRKISKGQRIFESLIVAVSAFASQMVLNTIITNIFWSLHIPNSDIFGTFGLPTITVLVVLAVFSLFLVVARKAKRW